MTDYRPTNPSGSATGRPAGQGLTGSEETRFRVGRGGGTYRYQTGKDSVNVFIDAGSRRKTLALPTDQGWFEFTLRGSTVVARPLTDYNTTYTGDLSAQTPVTLDTGKEVWSFHDDKAVSSRGKVMELGFSIDKTTLIGVAQDRDAAFYVASGYVGGQYPIYVTKVTEDGVVAQVAINLASLFYAGTGETNDGSNAKLPLFAYRKCVYATPDYMDIAPVGNSQAIDWFQAPPTFRIDLAALQGTLLHDTHRTKITESTNNSIAQPYHSVTLTTTVGTSIIYTNSVGVWPGETKVSWPCNTISSGQSATFTAPTSFDHKTDTFTREAWGAGSEFYLVAGNAYSPIALANHLHRQHTYTMSDGQVLDTFNYYTDYRHTVYRTYSSEAVSFSGNYVPQLSRIITDTVPPGYTSYTPVTIEGQWLYNEGYDKTENTGGYTSRFVTSSYASTTTITYTRDPVPSGNITSVETYAYTLSAGVLTKL